MVYDEELYGSEGCEVAVCKCMRRLSVCIVSYSVPAGLQLRRFCLMR